MKTYEEIMAAVKEQHENVKTHRPDLKVLMTMLVGSQNYGIAHENSDIDTMSLILPPLEHIATLKDPVSSEYEVNDGKCCYKDIRMALNLLIKTSPNSIEWFCSDYVVCDPNYEPLLSAFFSKENRKNFLYCDRMHMGYACKGMACQLKNRNMSNGKKYSHALRVRDMWISFMYGDTDNILKFRSEKTRKLAAEVKLKDDLTYQIKSEEIANEIGDLLAKYFEYRVHDEREDKNRKAVNNFQKEILKTYLQRELENV